ncbi:tRNA uridine-5-carboxymethylaminomethyl(34) synthesis GTPase MnmE [Mameliella sediminis]|uniref:tRNA uridine-5-carboxymethylaminomethyl(34) synthesis GTPase MnmE n=1 Tax=Mameliella sediminis TaxID=2836866 RepID=UPI001C491F24|nr:tRNA uridine-5-carboxymethylaminomethyl(34) synthesis GTPase MnmE [Mameliella sediminis]MBV7395312.1 tRNA uridine-5-carboxymethylaminomethyl(34) synthesis GTPase MnmE [Mameliella sediminis]
MDTIFALASAAGKAGVSVVRTSGPRAWDAVKNLGGAIPAPRMASVRRLVTPAGDFLDEALVLVFEEGASFTGERVAEFQVHGSVAVVQALLRELGTMEGFRGAEPGEFTRRALENEQLDLSQVEALADLIDSETEQQRRQALRLLTGALGNRVAGWRQKLLSALSLLEVTIDFVDEEVPVDVSDDVRQFLESVSGEIQRELQGLESAERLRLGFEVAIVGPPNAGKSTLLNYLAGREAAITSDVAGTTRDVIEVRMEIGGLAVTLLDTAGLRESEDSVEQIGVARARERAGSADLRVHLVLKGGVPMLAVEDGDIVVQAKADEGGCGVSGLTGAGVPALLETIENRLLDEVQGAGLASRERHRVALAEGHSHLEQALLLLEDGADLYDVTSEEVRIALRALEQLVGHVDVEQVLDHIFSSFCIGK